MKRRNSPHVPLIKSAFAFRVLLLVVTALSILGFIHFTQIVLEMQRHFAPGQEHPWDYWADGCFLTALIALAMYFLARTEQRVRRAPQGRVKSERVWRKARGQQWKSGESTAAAKRTRRRSGYNKGT